MKERNVQLEGRTGPCHNILTFLKAPFSQDYFHSYYFTLEKYGKEEEESFRGCERRIKLPREGSGKQRHLR